jgi:4-carboxymuconolactone decarboxylase
MSDPGNRAGDGTDGTDLTASERYDRGMRTRREVLGDQHVDRATAGITDFTRDFQEFITRTAWGDVWTRPGLARRDRSIAVLTSLIAHGHHEELAMHVRAALRNGLTREEIGEVILQSAIYSGVPAANTAFRIAQRVFAELDTDLDEG